MARPQRPNTTVSEQTHRTAPIAIRISVHEIGGLLALTPKAVEMGLERIKASVEELLQRAAALQQRAQE